VPTKGVNPKEDTKVPFRNLSGSSLFRHARQQPQPCGRNCFRPWGSALRLALGAFLGLD